MAPPLLFARRTGVPVLGAGISLLGKEQQKKGKEKHLNHLSKSSCGAPRDWQRDSQLPSFAASKELLSQPTSPLGGTLFRTSKTSCEAAPLELQASVETAHVQGQTTATSSIPLYGIPEWKKELSVPELRSHPFLEREKIVIKNTSFFRRLFARDYVSEITLIGCHHGSKYSAESVKQVLESVDPEIVFVELCPERAYFMERPADMEEDKPFDLIENIEYARKERCNGLPAIFASVRKTYAQHLLARHGSGLAGEMRAAAEFVKSKPKVSQPLLALGDLPSSFLDLRLNHLTTSPIPEDEASGEMWRLEDLYGCKAPRGLSINDEFEDRGYELMEKAWEEEETLAGYYVRAFLDNQDLSAVELNQRGLHDPKDTEKRATIQERDVYMVCRLLQFCQILKPKRVVVIIGAAHLQGMRHLLNAGIIGSTHKPDVVIAQLLSSTKSLAESESPLIRDWPTALSYYQVEMKVPITLSRNGVYYYPPNGIDEIEEHIK